jgi:hypothetical protein
LKRFLKSWVSAGGGGGRVWSANKTLSK